MQALMLIMNDKSTERYSQASITKIQIDQYYKIQQQFINMHHRSFTHSNWDSTPLKKQYYYHDQNMPSFGDSSFEVRQPLREHQNLKYKYQTKLDSKQELSRINELKRTNIDKINNKIKRILDTLNEEEKKIHLSNVKQNSQKRMTSRIKTEGDINEYTHNKGNKYEQLQQIRKKYNKTTQKIERKQVNNPTKEEQYYTFKSRETRTFETPIKQFNLKKSYVDDDMKKSKNYDKQISNIRDRIQSIEKMKRNLQGEIVVDFCTQPRIQKPKKVLQETPRQSFSQPKLKSNFHQSIVKQNFIFTEQKSQKKDLNSQKDELKKFIQCIRQQIQLDSQFRNLKKWLKKKSNSYKWIQLTRTLSLQNVPMNKHEIQQTFTLTQQEDNPFLTKRDSQGTIEELVERFLKSQCHWNKRIKHKFNRKKLQNDGIHQMDIFKAGQVRIEDMVRYINIESDQYYRNRDLFLIFKRITKSTEAITIDNMLKQVCQ